MAFASTMTGATAQSQPVSLSNHPLSGVWVAKVVLPANPGTPVAVPSRYGADGTVELVFPVSVPGQKGLQFKGLALGTWEVVDDRTGHFTVVQVLSDADGNYLGTLTLEGYPAVAEDGNTFEDSNPKGHGTIRDPLDKVVMTTPRSPAPVMGYRVTPGNPGFPEAQPTPVAIRRTRQQ